MNDPHVEWLEYEMKASCIFDNPPPLQWQGPDFDITLSSSILRADMRAHFPTEEAARPVVEQFLRAWEIDVALASGQRDVTFDFKHAHVVDRNPPPLGSPTTATLFAKASVSVSLEFQVVRRSYPAVPSNFSANPDVVSLWNRFEGYKEGRESIASMAYFSFTVIKGRYGSTDAASRALSVDVSVLRKVSELSTNRGDVSTARKMTADLAPFTAKETQWLDAATRALIRRIGEIASGHTPLQLTMQQLPKL